MRRRCSNPADESFQHYGERGITVCPQWQNDFNQFYADMGEAPKGMTLERIDNNKGYSPDNCRWATVREQLNNQRRNIRVEWEGETLTLGEWATRLNVPYDRLHKRIGRKLFNFSTQDLRKKPLVHGTRSGYEIFKCRCDECRRSNADRSLIYRKSRS